jgi:hypothetical protein
MHSIHRKKTIGLKNLLPREKCTLPVLSNLKTQLGQWVEEIKVDRDTRIEIDLIRNRAVNYETGFEFSSESACKALSLLKEENGISCEDLSLHCFGIRKYDSLIHQPKLFNMLTRLKKLCGSKPQFQIRSGRVLHTQNWDGVFFRHPPNLFRKTSQYINWSSLVASDRIFENHSSQSNMWQEQIVKLKRPFTRKEFESITEKPRSTSNRILVQWIESGFIRKMGQAKHSRYELQPRFFETKPLQGTIL